MGLIHLCCKKYNHRNDCWQLHRGVSFSVLVMWSLCTEILEGRIDGKRRRGRPMRRWTDDIKDWSNRSVAECSRLARDRQQWRLLVHEMICDPQ